MSMRTSIPNNNFASGQIDRDVKGRYDLPLFKNGHELSRNFFHTIKGDCYYRTGFEFIDNIGYSALYEFKFNQEQSYLLVFTTSLIKFWSYTESGEFVRVLDDNGDELSIEHPYGDEIFNLSLTQNCDVLYITHTGGQFPEKQLKRTASNKFTLTNTTFTNKGEASLSNVSADTNHGFPCTCVFYENRLNRCSSSKYPTYLYGSKGGTYDTLTVGTGTNDGYQFDLAEANSSALWMIASPYSLYIGTPEGILTVNGGSTTTAITPNDISAKLSCRVPVSKVLPVYVDGYAFFVTSNQRQIQIFEYDNLLEQFKSTSLSKGNYEITKGGIKKLAYKFDRFGLLFAVVGDQLLSLCFSNDESVNAQSRFITNGEFIDICSVTRPDGEYDLFANIKRTINGEEKYYLERLTETVEFSRFEDFISELDDELTDKEILQIKQDDEYAYYRTIAEELRNCNYLDCSIKYSGLHTETITLDGNLLTCSSAIFSSSDVGRRIWYKTITGREYGSMDIVEYISTSQVRVNILQTPTSNSTSQWYLSATVFSNLEHLEGETVAIVGNGGYIGDFVVKDGQIDISNANTNKVGSAIIGLKYKGVLKSPNLGLDISSQGTQTFTTMKNIYRIGLSLSNSAGGKVGDSMYYLNEVQNFNPDGLLDVPPLPMDSYVEINYEGTYDKEKHYFIVQDEPLPFHISMIVPCYKHVTKI